MQIRGCCESIRGSVRRGWKSRQTERKQTRTCKSITKVFHCYISDGKSEIRVQRWRKPSNTKIEARDKIM